MQIIFIHMTDYSISLLEDKRAVYSIHKLPLISIVVRRNEITTFFCLFVLIQKTSKQLKLF